MRQRVVRVALGFAALALVAGGAVPTYAASSRTSAPAPRASAAPAGPRDAARKFLGVVPSANPSTPLRRSSFGAARATPQVASSQVTYHGGPVQHSSAVYAIFWAPPSFPLPAGYQTIISQYFTDVAHDSYLPSNVYGSTTQYYDGAGGAKKFLSYNIAFKWTGVDSRSFPASGCPNYVLGDGSTSKVCLTNAQLEKELKSVIASHKLPKGLGTNYFLFTPQGVASCMNATALSSGGCYDPMQSNGYCAYHSHFGSGAQAVLYANMPYDAISGCTSGESPNANAADAVLNNASHEHNETITDPLGTAWYDSAGNEIADKCHLVFGASAGETSSGQFNEVINGHGYWLQQVWSNRARSCVQRNSFPQPVASFSFKPAVPSPGKKVTFVSSVHEPGETALTYRWAFPDGGVSSAKNPTHLFASAVIFGNVTLVVADRHGDQTRTVNVITVVAAK